MKVTYRCPKCKVKQYTFRSAEVMHWCKSQAGRYLPLHPDLEAPEE